MGTIADKRLRDLLPTVDAYRPAALAVAAILGLVFFLPGARGDDESPTAEFSAASTTDTTEAPSPTTTVPDESPTTTAPSGDTSFTPPPRPSSPPVTRDSTSSSPPTTEAGSGSGNDFSTDAPDDSEAAEPEPLRIVASGWASSIGGSPLSAADDVPEDTLPVGTRVGQADKVSFIRLAGDETTLELAEDASGRRGSEFETSPVQVCQITEGGWEEGGDQPMSAAPEYDAENCAVAQQTPEGTWSISLFLFGDPTDDRGFALVPSPDAPLDFQVTFAAQPVT